MSARKSVQWVVWLMIVGLLVGGCASTPTLPAPFPAPSESESGSAPRLPVPVRDPAPDVTADWSVYRDDVSSFALAYPPAWMFKMLEMDGSGIPDDWPVVSTAIFFPAEMRDRFERSGPPDPDLPPAIAPIQLQVFVGSAEQFRRAYVEPAYQEAVIIQGQPVTVEVQGESPHQIIHYVFTHPQNADVRVVLIDALSGFPARAAESPDLVALLPDIIGSGQFLASSAERGAADTRQVSVPEAGVQFEVPAAWTQQDAAWRWLVDGDAVEVGLAWRDLQPPMEAEAVMLPSSAQIVASMAMAVEWASARSFTLEVYDATAEGDAAPAPVQSVEQHILLQVLSADGRRVYDFFAVAPDAVALDAVSAALLQVVASAQRIEGGEVRARMRETVASQLGVTPADVTIISMDPVEWPTACLGIETAGQLCAQVITPGYRLMVEVAGTTYQFHTDASGDTVLLARG